MTSPNSYPRRVICAAVTYPNGAMLVGPRHFDAVMLKQYVALRLTFDESQCTTGFLDQEGVFMTREEAFGVAVAANQIVGHPGDTGARLFSEDLY